MSLPTDTEIDNAIRRLAHTQDGLLLYRRLQMVLMELPSSTDGGALQSSHGRRTFARELKSLMDSELAKAGLPSDRSGEHDPDAPAVVKPGESIAVARPGISRRVEPYADGGKPS